MPGTLHEARIAGTSSPSRKRHGAARADVERDDAHRRAAVGEALHADAVERLVQELLEALAAQQAEAARADDAEERIGIPEVGALEREQAVANRRRGNAGAPQPGDERARRRAAHQRRRQRGLLERLHDAGVREEAEEARRHDELERPGAQSIGQADHRARR